MIWKRRLANGFEEAEIEKDCVLKELQRKLLIVVIMFRIINICEKISPFVIITDWLFIVAFSNIRYSLCLINP